MLDELFEDFLSSIFPDDPAVLYGLGTVVSGGWLLVTRGPFPSVALAAGVVLGVGLQAAYEHTGLQQESTDGDRSPADWAALGIFVLVVVGIVIVGETDVAVPAVSSTQAVGVVTGLLAGGLATEWLGPALRDRVKAR